MPADGVRVLYVGHSTVLVEMDGTKILTDPVLRRRFMHLRRTTAVEASSLQDLDAVLVSHLHFDHLDFRSLARIGRGVPVVVPKGAGALLRRRHFRTHEVAVGEEIAVGAVTVTATQAVHPAGRLPFGIRAEPLGFVVRGSRSVYFAGDTDLFDRMAEVGPVDVALLPIWGWGPAIGTGHLSPERAVEAARLLHARVVIPIHWGTYFPVHLGLRRAPRFLEAPVEAFTALMAEASPDIEVRVLRPGTEATL